MGLTHATLNGHRATNARVTLPAWGCWYAEASLDEEVKLAGRTTLVINDLTLSGTILSGGPMKGRSSYRIVAGAGGWGRKIPKKAEVNDVGVKLSTVVLDAARLAGETMDTATIPDTRIGPAFARIAGPASRVLELVSPSAWYVGEDGKTRLGKRAKKALSAPATRINPLDKTHGFVELAAESIASIVPGVIVDGMEAVDVIHEISAKGGLRSTVWGQSQSSKTLDALREIFDQLDPGRPYRGVTEYRVVTLSGKRLNLQPVRVSTGMPDLRRVLARPGLSGSHSMLHLGSRVLVTFVDGSPARPVVVGFEDAEGDGFLPTLTTIDATLIRLGDGLLPAARSFDLAGPFPIATTNTKVFV